MLLSRLAVPVALLVALAVFLWLSVATLTPIHNALLQPPPIEKTERWPNPSHTLEAVVLTRNGGATVAYRTDIHVVPFGESPQGDPLILADHVEDLKVLWTSDQEVELHAQTARLFRIRHGCVVGNPPKPISIQLFISRPLSYQFDGAYATHGAAGGANCS